MPLDIEAQAKVPLITTTPLNPPSDPTKLSSLQVYQALIGDVDVPASQHPSFYHTVQRLEGRAKLWYWVSGITFASLVAMQIIFCLCIAIGAQVGFSMNAISIAAGINTLVAAAVAALKGLGLPEKKAVERYQLQKIMEEVEYTTRRLQAGLVVDAEGKADEARQMQMKTEDEAQVFMRGADADVLTSLVQSKGKGEKA